MKKMKLNIFFGLTVVLSLTSCLKKDVMNVDPNNKTAPYIQLTYHKGAADVNSGLNFFSHEAVIFTSADPDTVTFEVELGGPGVATKDVTITTAVDFSALQDNYNNDGLTYQEMPADAYKILNSTATIKAGQTQAPIQIVFYPDKINTKLNFGLPIKVSDSQGYTVSSNYGKLYLHTIGNPLTGVYSWDYYRYNTQDGSGPLHSTSFIGATTVFAPVNATSFKVQSGYPGPGPNYLVTFDDNGSGVLSNFKAAIAPDEIKSNFTDAGITVVSGPTIDVSSDYKTFTIKYVVTNSTGAYRNITDVYYK